MDRPYNGHPAPSECGPSRGSGSHYHYHFLLWTTRGANLTFDYGNTIYMVDIEGTEVRAVAKTNSDFHRSAYGFHADASPDHNRIVYSSCEFRTEREVYYSERAKYNYEIVLLDLHTGEQQRLTRNTRLEHYPVWSPDGSRIVYIGSPPNPRPLTAYSRRLYTMSAEGSQGQLVVPTVRALAKLEEGPDDAIGMYPPAWSPDGERLAFILNVRNVLLPRSHLYTVRQDGSELKRLVEDVVSMAAWSPDGQRIAVAGRAGDAVEIKTMATDGSDEKLITYASAPSVAVEWPRRGRVWIHTLSWSPDGSQLMFSCGQGVCVVNVNDGRVTRLVEGVAAGDSTPYIAAWSPDGTRVALFAPGDPDFRYPQYTIPPVLYTVARDGTNRRDLIRLDDDGNLVPANATRRAP